MAVIDDFIIAELARLEKKKFNLKKPHAETEKLNQLFRNALKEIWG